MKTIPQLSLMALEPLGISKPSKFDGTFATFGELAPNDRIRVTNWVSAYIKNNPAEFTPEIVNIADGPNGTGWHAEELNEHDSLESAEDFFTALGESAYNVVGKPLVNIGESASALAMALPLILLTIGGVLLYQKLKP